MNPNYLFHMRPNSQVRSAYRAQLTSEDFYINFRHNGEVFEPVGSVLQEWLLPTNMTARRERFAPFYKF